MPVALCPDCRQEVQIAGNCASVQPCGVFLHWHCWFRPRPMLKASNTVKRPPTPPHCPRSSSGRGERRELGEVICITASCQTWTAKCDMSLNNVMWRKLQDGCPAASVDPSPSERLQRLFPSANPGLVDTEIASTETQAG